MHNDFGSKQPVQSDEPNAIPWDKAYIQNLSHVIDAILNEAR